MTWEPTDQVPPSGMAAYAEPDPALQPLTELSGGLRLHRIEERGAWARVAADNGWSAWVDGRLLVPIAAAPADLVEPTPAPPIDALPTNPPTPTPTPTPAPTPAPASPDQTIHQPIGAVTPRPDEPLGGTPLGAPSAPLGGVPSAFAPPAGSTAASASGGGIAPLAIGAALLGVLLVVTYLLPWATFGGSSDHAFELAGDGRSAFGDFGARTDIGIVLMQLLYGAIVLGPVAAVLFVARQPAARVVGILAGAAGVLIVIGRLILDVPSDPGLGLGFWLSLLTAIALAVVSIAAANRGAASTDQRSGTW